MENIHTAERLRELQALPLERKVGFTAARITEFYEHYNGKVAVSFSGGKDSTVLLYIARQLYPDIKAVYCDAGLEFPEIKEFVKTWPDVDIVRPEKSFRKVIEEEGYPVVSKEVAKHIREKRAGMPYAVKRWEAMQKMERDGSIKRPFWYGTLARWRHLENAPFKISERCCDIMKKKPMALYEKKNGVRLMVATMASESLMRKQAWLRTGCNAFDSKHPVGKPMSFWTEQDVLEYLHCMGIPIASVYGRIACNGNQWCTTGESRTGCMFCLFGCHLEKEPNKIQRLAWTYPKIYKYILDDLGFEEVMEYMGIPYKPVPNLFYMGKRSCPEATSIPCCQDEEPGMDQAPGQQSQLEGPR